MATALFFHAHPDDEAIATGGTIAKAVASGHRAIIVTATGGEHGAVADGFLRPGETLGERRAVEMQDAAVALGADHAFLGYVDSGMEGTPENDAPDCFWQADLDDAAEKLAEILTKEQVDVLVVYDDHGGYGHPDHVQVHRVGVRAAGRAGTKVVLESTIDRDRLRSLMAMAAELGLGGEEGAETPEVALDDSFGSAAHQITTRVDVRDFLEQKRKAMAAHASQIAETSFFLAMPPQAFEAVWGTEEFIRRGDPIADDVDIFTGI
ncbi:MAG: PIG-L family deacetylase [Acidimicrobiales bacterium]